MSKVFLYIKRSLKIVGFFALLSFGVFFLNRTLPTYKQASVQSMYGNPFRYDAVFLGASTVYTRYSPSVIAEKNDVNSLNLATPNQNFDDTYYLLREVYKYQTPKFVFIGTGIPRMFSDDDDYGSSLILSSMRSSYNRCEFYLVDFTLKDALDIFRISTRDFSIKTFLKGDYWRDFQKAIKNPPEESITYSDGFVYIEKEYESTTSGPYTREISDRADYYLKKSIELCQKNGSTVILLNPPISPRQFKINEKTDFYQRYFNDIADEYGVENWDFSFLKKEIIEYSLVNFGDDLHTNGQGGLAYSRVLRDIMYKYINDEFVYEDYFYNTHEECVKGQNL